MSVVGKFFTRAGRSLGVEAVGVTPTPVPEAVQNAFANSSPDALNPQAPTSVPSAFTQEFAKSPVDALDPTKPTPDAISTSSFESSQPPTVKPLAPAEVPEGPSPIVSADVTAAPAPEAPVLPVESPPPPVVEEATPPTVENIAPPAEVLPTILVTDEVSDVPAVTAPEPPPAQEPEPRPEQPLVDMAEPQEEPSAPQTPEPAAVSLAEVEQSGKQPINFAEKFLLKVNPDNYIMPDGHVDQEKLSQDASDPQKVSEINPAMGNFLSDMKARGVDDPEVTSRGLQIIYSRQQKAA